MQQSYIIDLTYDANNPLIDAYFESIQKARDTIAGQWRECTWDKKGLDVQAPATTDEVITMSTRPFSILYVNPAYIRVLNIACIPCLCR